MVINEFMVISKMLIKKLLHVSCISKKLCLFYIIKLNNWWYLFPVPIPSKNTPITPCQFLHQASRINLQLNPSPNMAVLQCDLATGLTCSKMGMCVCYWCDSCIYVKCIFVSLISILTALLESLWHFSTALFHRIFYLIFSVKTFL